jgi:16S rRNA (adenine(1408)-N(1))-methyltransferase
VTVDVGTGDGRAVLAAAARHSTTLTLGLDANASAMAEASRRAAGRPRKGGLSNAGFILAAAESPPDVLRASAELVTVLFPWGSLLRGVLGADPAVAAGVAGRVASGGTLQLLLAPAGRDGLEGVPTSIDGVVAGAAAAFDANELSVADVHQPSVAEIAATGSTWARRLGPARVNGRTIDRPATLIRLVRR